MKVFKTKEVCQMLKCSLSTVYRLVRAGELSGFRLGSKRQSRIRIFLESAQACEKRRAKKCL